MTELNERGDTSKIYQEMLKGAAAGVTAFLGGLLPGVAKSTALYYAGKIGSWLLSIPTFRSKEGMKYAASLYEYEPLKEKFLKLSPGLQRTRAKLTKEELKEVEDFEREIFRELQNDENPNYQEMIERPIVSKFAPLYQDLSTFRLPSAVYAGPNYAGGRYFSKTEKFKAKDLAVLPTNNLDTWAREHDIGFALASSIRDPKKRHLAQQHANTIFNARIKAGLKLDDLPGDYTNTVYDFLTNKLPLITSVASLLSQPLKSTRDYWKFYRAIDDVLVKGRRPSGGLEKEILDIVDGEEQSTIKPTTYITGVDEEGRNVYEEDYEEVFHYVPVWAPVKINKKFEVPYVQSFLSSRGYPQGREDLEQFKFFYEDPRIREELKLDEFARLWDKIDTSGSEKSIKRNQKIQWQLNRLEDEVNRNLISKGLISEDPNIPDQLLVNSEYGTWPKRIKKAVLNKDFLKEVSTALLSYTITSSIDNVLKEIEGKGINERKYVDEKDFRDSINAFVKKYEELPRANRRLADAAELVFRYIQNEIPYVPHTDAEIKILLEALDVLDVKDQLVQDVLRERPQLAEVFIRRDRTGEFAKDRATVAQTHYEEFLNLVLKGADKESLETAADEIEKIEKFEEYGASELTKEETEQKIADVIESVEAKIAEADKASEAKIAEVQSDIENLDLGKTEESTYNKILYGLENGIVTKEEITSTLQNMDILEIIDLFGII